MSEQNLEPRRRGAEGPLDPERHPSIEVRIAFWLFMAVTMALVLAFTPLTYQLDDIKIFIMNVGGLVLLAVFLGLWAFDRVEAPPAIVSVPWLAFLAVNVISTLMAPFPGARTLGWAVTWFYFSLTGFIFLGCAVIRTKRAAEGAIRFWMVVALATTLFGLFHYGGGMSLVWEAVAQHWPPDSKWRNLIWTFRGTREMLSTILNTQFFGNFLVMIMPVAASGVFFAASNYLRRRQAGESVVGPVFWMAASAVIAVVSTICIYLTYQKSSLYLLPVVVVGYLIALRVFGILRFRTVPETPTIVVCALATAAFIGWLTAADLVRRIVPLEKSVQPRTIMFTAAIEQFKDHVVFGAGPGSYRLFFPEYRDPDFHLYRIANVTEFSHNWLLDLLAEVGLAGTISYCVFLGAIVWLGWLALRRCQDDALRAAVIGFLVGLFSILAGNMATPMTRWPIGAGSLHAFAGTALGVIVVALRSNLSDPVPSTRIHPLLPVAKQALALGSLIFVFQAWGWQSRVWEANKLHALGLGYTELREAQTDPKRDPQARYILQEAVKALTKAIELDPLRPTSYYRLAYAYNRLELHDDAMKTYRRLEALSPDYSEVQFNFGVLYYNRFLEIGGRDATRSRSAAAIESLDLALKYFRRAAEVSSKVGVRRQLAFVSLVLSQVTEGQRSREAALEAARTLEALSSLSVERLKQDESLDGADPVAYREDLLRRAADAYRQAGDFASQARLLADYLRARPGDTALLKTAVTAFLAADQQSKAEAFLEELVLRNPLNPDFQLAKFDLFQESKAPDAPNRAFDQAAFLLEVARRVPGFLSARDRARLERVVNPPPKIDEAPAAPPVAAPLPAPQVLPPSPTTTATLESTSPPIPMTTAPGGS